MVFLLYNNRPSFVKICNFSTQSRPFHCGVPRGSVLGPSYSQYTSSPLHDIIDQFPDINYHIYADDIQLYSFLSNPSNLLPDNSQLCKCALTNRS